MQKFKTLNISTSNKNELSRLLIDIRDKNPNKKVIMDDLLTVMISVYKKQIINS